MGPLLTAKPINVQVRHRTFFAPPCYEIYKVEVSTALAAKFAETYGLKSTDIIVNQNAAASQYLSFRYFLQGEPIRYMDAFVGIDQGELVFSNPATVLELVNEFGRAWKIILETLSPMIRNSYFEATLHCETEKPGTKAFLDEMVKVPSESAELRRGFSLMRQFADSATKLSLEVSDSVQDGLYVAFASVSTEGLRDMSSFSRLYESTLTAYRTLQNIASVHIVEPT